MFNSNFFIIYRIFVSSGGRRSAFVENYFDFDGDASISVDDRRNEPYAYQYVFSPDQQCIIERFYKELLERMSEVSYSECSDFLEALDFVQEISAAALWKYNQKLTNDLENFVRNFDRIDLTSERMRLYECAKNINIFGR